jgi:hypothetical protein
MSRKHYIEVAKVIRSEVEKAEASSLLPETVQALTVLAEELADMFKADNSRFDRARFMTACGLGGAE